MKVTLSPRALRLKIGVERLLGQKITFENREKHPNKDIKPIGFLEGNIIYLPGKLADKEKERIALHELVHLYLKCVGFPQVSGKEELLVFEKTILDKILSLAEDLFVEKFLRKNEYPASTWDYEKIFSKLKEIDQSGGYINIGRSTIKNSSGEFKFLLMILHFIRLLVDEKHKKANDNLINKICIKNIGTRRCKIVTSVAEGISAILKGMDLDQVKLYKMFIFLIRKFGLEGKVCVNLDCSRIKKDYFAFEL